MPDDRPPNKEQIKEIEVLGRQIEDLQKYKEQKLENKDLKIENATLKGMIQGQQSQFIIGNMQGGNQGQSQLNGYGNQQDTKRSLNNKNDINKTTTDQIKK